SSLLGGSSTSGTTITLGNLTVSPTTVAATSTNNPASAVTVTMTAVGLTSTTSIPLTWTDDTGSHQLNITSSGNTTWSVSVPASSTQTSDMTTTDGGATWKIVLAAGTQLHGGLSTTFTFTATRQSDNATASTTVSVLQA